MASSTRLYDVGCAVCLCAHRWANWFRTRVQLAPGTAPDDPAVLSHAMNLAVSADAAHLPGYKQNGQQAG